jgi:CRP-like cAMP-binding protein
VLEGVVEREGGCGFRCLSVPAREALPARWRTDYAFGLVRRGTVVRQRVDGSGRATAIDIAGPGSALPLGTDDGSTGYAVDDVMVCVCPTSTFDEALGAKGARDVVKAQSAILQRVERIAEARSRTSAIARLATLLLAIGDTLSPLRALNVISSAIQQRDLAALLAMRHESVCRSMATLEKQGLVERNPSGLRLVDRAALEAL